MIRKMAIIAVLALVANMATAASQMTISSAVTAAYDLEGNPPAQLPNIRSQMGQAFIYQVDFSIQVNSLPTGFTGFGGAALNLDLLPGLVIPVVDGSIQGYMADASQIYNKPSGIGRTLVNVWSSNGDYGDTNDLQAMAISINTAGWQGAVDNRRNLATTGPLYFGSAFVTWDGVTETDLLLDFYQGGYVTSAGILEVDHTASLVGEGIHFVPEPATITLVVLGGMAIARRRIAKAVV